MTLDLESWLTNGRQAFAGDDWLFPVQLSRVAGLTDHIKNGSVETSLVTF